ncbi:hypothetical protein IWQ56_005579 [Coemansia nantahalensis]|nr:hypothetical protein IWQ56_005579 [Coemansia nantahalensis]
MHRATIKIAFRDVTRISKELTLGVCPNAITVSTHHRQFIFTNLVRRDCAFSRLTEQWHAAVEAHATMDSGCSAALSPQPTLPLQSGVSAKCIRMQPADDAKLPAASAGDGVIGHTTRHPHVLPLQLAGEVSRSTQFVLLSAVLFCLLSTLVP